MLYIAYSDALKNYSCGYLIADAESEDEARAKMLMAARLKLFEADYIDHEYRARKEDELKRDLKTLEIIQYGAIAIWGGE